MDFNFYYEYEIENSVKIKCREYLYFNFKHTNATPFYLRLLSLTRKSDKEKL